MQNPRIGHIHAITEEAGAIAIAVRDALVAESDDIAKPRIERVERGRKTMGDLLAKLDSTLTDTTDEAKKTQEALHASYGTYTIEQVKLTRAMASVAVHTAAGEIARGNTELSHRSESNAASLQQTAASVEAPTGTVKHNADRARQAAQLSSEASAVAGEGGQIVE